MTQPIRKFSTSASTPEIVAEIRENGVAVVENLFSTDEMDTLVGIVRTELDKQEPGRGEFFANQKARSVSRLFARGVEFSEIFLQNERVLELEDAILLPENPMARSAEAKKTKEADSSREEQRAAERFFTRPDPLVGPNCHHYRVNASVAMEVCRGGEHQGLHRDQYRYQPYMHRDPAGPELTLATMVAGTDFTAENGATRFIPRSNHWPADRQPEEHEIVQAEMPKGSAAFWLGSVLHGFAKSSVDEPRTGFIYSFGLDYLAQEENQFLAVPPEIARTLPLQARQLLGYRSSPAINWVEGLDRNDMLAEGASSLFS
jgi:ectoine hydroxylase-related dioxygenase (phytanoyl-CoA dioxygenase family)